MERLSETNKILFITLSNIGDVILTLPVLDCLRARFPEARITVLVGPRPKEIFENNPYIHQVIVYDKHAPVKEKIKLFNNLKKENFKAVIDLRNSLFGLLLPAQYRTSAFRIIPKSIRHMKDRHLYKIQNLKIGDQNEIPKDSLYIKPQEEEYISRILKGNKIKDDDTIIVIAPGARSHIKRWSKEKFLELIPKLGEEFKRPRIILAGDKDDSAIAKYITDNCRYPVVDLIAKTKIGELAALLKKTRLVVTNDSAVLHLASYLNTPVAAIFGPTDELKYGPWSKARSVIKKDLSCRPCRKAQCKLGILECMSLIKMEDVLRQVRNLINAAQQPATIRFVDAFKRILIVRTDRIGDVLLSTPVIKALREAYPNAFIAMMVSPYAKDIVSGNPCLDEVIIYDKDGKHKSWRRSMKFSRNLKKKKFEAAIILHPTNRAHLMTYFAGIPKRIGFNRKFGFLLTDRIEHGKQLGERHELEYTLDLVRYLGIEPKDKSPFMPIKPEAENWVADIFRQQGIREIDKLLAIHPGASCPSKIWPNVRFAEVADRLIGKYGFKVLLVCGPKDITLAQQVIKNMHHPAVNLAGRTSVSQLASVLKRCCLFISNDSGPVHIASAVGTPVISIFGRSQKGLSPTRWGPLGLKDKILHQEVGCIECLAHNCTKQFACLKAITVDDVLNAADAILKS